MKRNRLDPPHKMYVLPANGRRERIKARQLIIELGKGIEIEVDLAPHPNFAGQLVLFAAPTAQMEQLYDEGTVDDFNVAFGGPNVLHVFVNRRLVPAAGATPIAHGPKAARRRSRSNKSV